MLKSFELLLILLLGVAGLKWSMGWENRHWEVLVPEAWLGILTRSCTGAERVPSTAVIVALLKQPSASLSC